MRVILCCLILILFAGLTVLGQPPQKVKLVGQVVCSACWFESNDRKKDPYGTPADLDCAKDCSEKGLPQALAVEEGNGFKLYTMERGDYKGKGKDFLDMVPNTVEVEGIVRTVKDKNFIQVNAIKVIRDSSVLPKLNSDDASLALKDMFGGDVNLGQYRGRFVVLNFWATWCEPCKKEMPDLSAIQNDYAATGVQVIGASGDALEESAKVLKFSKQYKVNFPVWLGATTADMERFGVGRVLPATVIIDREGKIVWRVVGIVKPSVLRKELDKLIAESMPTASRSKKQGKNDNSSLVPA